MLGPVQGPGTSQLPPLEGSAQWAGGSHVLGRAVGWVSRTPWQLAEAPLQNQPQEGLRLICGLRFSGHHSFVPSSVQEQVHAQVKRDLAHTEMPPSFGPHDT